MSSRSSDRDDLRDGSLTDSAKKRCELTYYRAWRRASAGVRSAPAAPFD
jgi:hypothetical protein